MVAPAVHRRRPAEQDPRGDGRWGCRRDHRAGEQRRSARCPGEELMVAGTGGGVRRRRPLESARSPDGPRTDGCCSIGDGAQTVLLECGRRASCRASSRAHERQRPGKWDAPQGEACRCRASLQRAARLRSLPAHVRPCSRSAPSTGTAANRMCCASPGCSRRTAWCWTSARTSGIMTVHLARARAERGHVHSFEPMPENFSTLRWLVRPLQAPQRRPCTRWRWATPRASCEMVMPEQDHVRMQGLVEGGGRQRPVHRRGEKHVRCPVKPPRRPRVPGRASTSPGSRSTSRTSRSTSSRAAASSSSRCLPLVYTELGQGENRTRLHGVLRGPRVRRLRGSTVTRDRPARRRRHTRSTTSSSARMSCGGPVHPDAAPGLG